MNVCNRRLLGIGLFLLYCLILTATKAPAIELELYTGGTVDTRGQGYQYFGLGVGQPVTERWTFMGKVVGNYLHYQYESGPRIIRASAPGVRFQIGPKYFDEQRYFILTGGLDYRNTSLSHRDPASRTRGARTGGTIEAIYSQALTETFRTDLVLNYSSIGDFTWGRARLKHLIAVDPTRHRIFVGLEGIGQGNRDYNAQQIGPMVEFQRLQEQFSIVLSGGYKRSSTFTHTAYFGLELYYKIR